MPGQFSVAITSSEFNISPEVEIETACDAEAEVDWHSALLD